MTRHVLLHIHNLATLAVLFAVFNGVAGAIVGALL